MKSIEMFLVNEDVPGCHSCGLCGFQSSQLGLNKSPSAVSWVVNMVERPDKPVSAPCTSLNAM